ncbi:MAG: asparagine--tRNA ligase [Erysipelotrichaceae bacterium]
MFEFITVRELYEILMSGSHVELDGIEYVQLQGWIRTNRCNGKIGFIELNDGTYFRNIQLVYSDTMKNFEEVSHYRSGVAISAMGKFILTPQGKQAFEIQLNEVVLEGDCDEDYPLQKKRHSFEYMREIAHLRPRANTFYAIYRLRSVLSMGIHEFFQNQGFVYVHTPIITGNDGEGAGEIFHVTTKDKEGKHNNDFFGKPGFLTVTGQLHVEAFALAFRDVYTFGPAFRAENSNTPRHGSEFWMVEPEIAFAGLDDNMDLIEDMVKFCITYVLENAPEEMKFFNEMIDKDAINRITKVRNSEFKRMRYDEAIELLKNADVKFDYPVEWGIDLQSEHERYICEKVIEGPVFLTDYPKDIKAFYMRVNDDNKTVAACDLLVPGVGELVGGSQREERYDMLEKRMKEMGMAQESLQWYMDLRRFGGCKHAGFGLGFDRFLMYITGMGNIRDVQPFPRTPKNMNF